MPCHDAFYNVSTNNSTNIMNYDNANCDTRKLSNVKRCQKIDAYFPSDSRILQDSKFTILYTNHRANHRMTTASPTDTNHCRTIRSYSIRPIDTWEIERINQLSAPNCCFEIFTFAPLTRYLFVLFTTATRECKCVCRARKADRCFFFLIFFLLWIPERSVELEKQWSLVMIHHCRQLFFPRRDSRLLRPACSTTTKARTIIDIWTIWIWITIINEQLHEIL